MPTMPSQERKRTEWDELFDAWKAHPVTVKMYEHLGEMRKDLLEAWASRSFVGEVKHISDTANGHAIGLCEGFQRVIDLKADDLTGEDDG